MKMTTHRTKGRKSLVLILAAVGLGISSVANAITYPAPPTTGPSGVAIPPSFEPFTPPVDGTTPAGGMPQIAEWAGGSP